MVNATAYIVYWSPAVNTFTGYAACRTPVPPGIVAGQSVTPAPKTLDSVGTSHGSRIAQLLRVSQPRTRPLLDDGGAAGRTHISVIRT